MVWQHFRMVYRRPEEFAGSRGTQTVKTLPYSDLIRCKSVVYRWESLYFNRKMTRSKLFGQTAEISVQITDLESKFLQLDRDRLG